MNIGINVGSRKAWLLRPARDRLNRPKANQDRSGREWIIRNWDGPA